MGHQFFHRLLAQDSAVKVSEVLLALSFIKAIKSDFGQLMVNDVPIYVFRAVFNSGINFPEKLEFVELIEIMDVLKDFIEVFSGPEGIFLINDFETFQKVKVEMVMEISFNNLINDIKSDISGDVKELEFVVSIELFDGLDVVGLED